MYSGHHQIAHTTSIWNSEGHSYLDQSVVGSEALSENTPDPLLANLPSLYASVLESKHSSVAFLVFSLSTLSTEAV